MSIPITFMNNVKKLCTVYEQEKIVVGILLANLELSYGVEKCIYIDMLF